MLSHASRDMWEFGKRYSHRGPLEGSTQGCFVLRPTHVNSRAHGDRAERAEADIMGLGFRV